MEVRELRDLPQDLRKHAKAKGDREVSKDKREGCSCVVWLLFLAGLVIPMWAVSLPLCWIGALILHHLQTKD
jgi:hypothetical protein